MAVEWNPNEQCSRYIQAEIANGKYKECKEQSAYGFRCKVIEREMCW